MQKMGVNISLISVVQFLAIWYIPIAQKFSQHGRSQAVWQTDLGY